MAIQGLELDGATWHTPGPYATLVPSAWEPFSLMRALLTLLHPRRPACVIFLLPCVPLMGAFPTVGLRGPRRSDPEPGLSASRLPGPETLARLLPAVHLLLDWLRVHFFQAAFLEETWRLFLSRVSASLEQHLPPLILCPDLLCCLWIESSVILCPYFFRWPCIITLPCPRMPTTPCRHP